MFTSDRERREAAVLAGVCVLVVAILVPLVLIPRDGPDRAEASASLAVIVAGAQISKPGSGFAAVDRGERVPAGSAIRTDESGFVQVGYEDDSLTRFGPATIARVRKLDYHATPRRIAVDLDVGKTLHRATAADTTYLLHTRTAVARGRGADFSVECETTMRCRIVVVKGVVDVFPSDAKRISLTDYDAVTIDGGVVADLRRFTDAELAGDPWIQLNRAYDESVVPPPPSTASPVQDLASPPPPEPSSSAPTTTRPNRRPAGDPLPSSTPASEPPDPGPQGPPVGPVIGPPTIVPRPPTTTTAPPTTTTATTP